MSVQKVFEKYINVFRKLGSKFDFYAVAPALEKQLTVQKVPLNSAQFVEKIVRDMERKDPPPYLKQDLAADFLRSLPDEWKAKKVSDDLVKRYVNETNWGEYRDSKWIKQNHMSATGVTDSWSDEDTSVYVDTFLSDQFIPHGVYLKDLSWEYVPAFPLSKVTTTDGKFDRADWLEWWKDEQKDYPTLEKDWDSESEPILLIMKGDEGVINDGHHRTAVAYLRGMSTIPAVVGKVYRKGVESALHSVDDLMSSKGDYAKQTKMINENCAELGLSRAQKQAYLSKLSSLDSSSEVDRANAKKYLDKVHKKGPKEADAWWGADGFMEDDHNPRIVPQTGPAETSDPQVTGKYWKAPSWPRRGDLVVDSEGKIGLIDGLHGIMKVRVSWGKDKAWYPTKAFSKPVQVEDPLKALPKELARRFKRQEGDYGPPIVGPDDAKWTLAPGKSNEADSAAFPPSTLPEYPEPIHHLKASADNFPQALKALDKLSWNPIDEELLSKSATLTSLRTTVLTSKLPKATGHWGSSLEEWVSKAIEDSGVQKGGWRVDVKQDSVKTKTTKPSSGQEKDSIVSFDVVLMHTSVTALDKSVSTELIKKLKDKDQKQAQDLTDKFAVDRGMQGDDLSDLMYDLYKAGYHNLKKPKPSANQPKASPGKSPINPRWAHSKGFADAINAIGTFPNVVRERSYPDRHAAIFSIPWDPTVTVPHPSLLESMIQDSLTGMGVDKSGYSIEVYDVKESSGKLTYRVELCKPKTKASADDFNKSWEPLGDGKAKNYGGDLWASVQEDEETGDYEWVMTFGQQGPSLDSWSGHASDESGAMSEADEAAQNLQTAHEAKGLEIGMMWGKTAVDESAPITEKMKGDGLLGKRYPRAKRKLSEKDIERLDVLFHKMNRMGRGPEFDKLNNEANKLLGFDSGKRHTMESGPVYDLKTGRQRSPEEDLAHSLKKGDRVVMVKMADDGSEKHPIPPGTKGTVEHVNWIYKDRGEGQLSVKWDNGSSLMVLIPEDKIERVEAKKVTAWEVDEGSEGDGEMSYYDIILEDMNQQLKPHGYHARVIYEQKSWWLTINGEPYEIVSTNFPNEYKRKGSFTVNIDGTEADIGLDDDGTTASGVKASIGELLTTLLYTKSEARVATALDKKESDQLLELLNSVEDRADKTRLQGIINTFVERAGYTGDDLNDLMYDLQKAGYHNLKKPVPSAKPNVERTDSKDDRRWVIYRVTKDMSRKTEFLEWGPDQSGTGGWFDWKRLRDATPFKNKQEALDKIKKLDLHNRYEDYDIDAGPLETMVP